MTTSLLFSLIFISSLFIAGCAQKSQFSPASPDQFDQKVEAENFSLQRTFAYQPLEDFFVQDNLGQQKQFELSQMASEVNPNLQVLVNGVGVTNFNLYRSVITFSEPPQALAEIKVIFDPRNLELSVTVEDLILPDSLDVETLSVTYNEKSVSLGELGLYRNEDGFLVLDPRNLIYHFEDLYSIRLQKEFSISVNAKYVLESTF